MNLSSRISEFIGLRKTTGDVGIEIEAELNRDIHDDLLEDYKYWALHGENSLRKNGIEFVFRKPLDIKDVDLALKELDQSLHKSKLKFLDSKRASVHVHVNVQNHRLIDLYNTLCAYWIVEPLLLEYCGKHRNGNLFCLSLATADAIHSEICEGLKTFAYLKNFKQTDRYRYSSINLEAVYKFGSVEYRTMRCTQDFKVISEWTNALYTLTQAGKHLVSPTQIVRYATDKTPRDFLQLVLPSSFIATLKGIVPPARWSDLLSQNLWYVMDVASSRKHWDLQKDLEEQKKRDQYPSLKQMDSGGGGDDNGDDVHNAAIAIPGGDPILSEPFIPGGPLRNPHFGQPVIENRLIYRWDGQNNQWVRWRDFIRRYPNWRELAFASKWELEHPFNPANERGADWVNRKTLAIAEFNRGDLNFRVAYARSIQRFDELQARRNEARRVRVAHNAPGIFNPARIEGILNPANPDFVPFRARQAHHEDVGRIQGGQVPWDAAQDPIEGDDIAGAAFWPEEQTNPDLPEEDV